MTVLGKSFPLELIDQTLLFVPNFQTLHAVILSSKAMHAVFAAHPHSIAKAVASNMLGPALPSALNLVRYQHPEGPLPVFGAAATVEPTEVGVITPEEARKLSKNAAVVNRFQNIFSAWHQSELRKLNPVESLRFSRALYRIMLFQTIFPSSTATSVDGDTEAETEVRAAQKDFFTMFPTPELCEIQTVSNFIKGLAKSLLRKVTSHGWLHCEHGLAMPAAMFLRAYEAQDPAYIEGFFTENPMLHGSHPLLLGYIAQALEDVRQGREEPPLAEGSSCSKYILGVIEGERDTCQKCDANEGD